MPQIEYVDKVPRFWGDLLGREAKLGIPQYLNVVALSDAKRFQGPLIWRHLESSSVLVVSG